MATIYQGTRGNLEFLGRELRRGELVGVPTETVYGLAANALDERACRKIFTAKGRPSTDPLIVHVGSVRAAQAVAVVGTAARKVMRAFWPGPLTIVLPKRDVVPAVVTSGRDSVAVRMPAHPLMRRLLAAADRPLAAPSANVFGYVSPTTAEHVERGLGKKIKHVLDGGACAIGVESTILDLRDEARPRVLRPGKIGAREIARVLGRKVEAAKPTQGKTSQAQLAPGMLARHYSPKVRVRLHPKITADAVMSGKPNEAWVVRRKGAALRGFGNVVTWGKGDSLAVMAKHVFAVLRELDGGSWATLHVELAPERRGARDLGLAVAINDRLRRAATR